MAFRRVARADEVAEGQGFFVDADGLRVAVFNAGGGRFYACTDVCPHEEGPLSEGWLEGDAVVCPWHGFDFELATGRCRVDPNLSIRVFPVRLLDGAVEIDLP